MPAAWSSWIDHDGKGCPLPVGTAFQAKVEGSPGSFHSVEDRVSGRCKGLGLELLAQAHRRRRRQPVGQGGALPLAQAGRAAGAAGDCGWEAAAGDAQDAEAGEGLVFLLEPASPPALDCGRDRSRDWHRSGQPSRERRAVDLQRVSHAALPPARLAEQFMPGEAKFFRSHQSSGRSNSWIQRNTLSLNPSMCVQRP